LNSELRRSWLTTPFPLPVKDGCIISLTLGDLQNLYFAVEVQGGIVMASKMTKIPPLISRLTHDHQPNHFFKDLDTVAIMSNVE
jgi:hypothetical protein